MVPAVHEVLRVAFHVYCWPGLPLQLAADRLRLAVALPLSSRHGPRRGPYYRWSGDDGADLLLQANVPDESGLPLEPEAPVDALLVYATGLPESVHAALAAIEGLALVTADVVAVPRLGPAPRVVPSAT